MSVTISIPEDIAAVLGGTVEEREVRIKEALALELYREGKISLRRVGELAGVGGDYWAADAFRSLHGVPAFRQEAADLGEEYDDIALCDLATVEAAQELDRMEKTH